MSKPSERAVEAARAAASEWMGDSLWLPSLEAAHDPALGEDASVRLGDIWPYIPATARMSIERAQREGRL